MKAYILSEQHGTIQLGYTVYQIPTNIKFRTNTKADYYCPEYEVKSNSWKSAKEAMCQHIEG